MIFSSLIVVVPWTVKECTLKVACTENVQFYSNKIETNERVSNTNPNHKGSVKRKYFLLAVTMGFMLLMD